MHNVTLTGTIVHGPRLSFRNQEPHVELFLRTHTHEVGLFGAVGATINSHLIHAQGKLALELWTRQPHDRISIRGDLIWTTFPCEPDDCRTFVHVEAGEIAFHMGSTTPDRNLVELTATLIHRPSPMWDGMTRGVVTLAPRGDIDHHLLTVLAVGQAAPILADAIPGETLLFTGHLHTDLFEPCDCKLRVQAHLLASMVTRSEEGEGHGGFGVVCGGWGMEAVVMVN